MAKKKKNFTKRFWQEAGLKTKSSKGDSRRENMSAVLNVRGGIVAKELEDSIPIANRSC
jgi:hypothetical protein